MTTLLYIAADGNYGDASDLLLIDAREFDNEDYLTIDNENDSDRQEKGAEIALAKEMEPLKWFYATEYECAQILDTLEAAINALTFTTLTYNPYTKHYTPAIGLAEELGDIRDLFSRSGITGKAKSR